MKDQRDSPTESRFGSRFWYSLIISLLTSVGFVLTCLLIVKNPNLYGAWLFFVTPMVGGAVGGVVANWKTDAPKDLIWRISISWYTLICIPLLGVRLEGALCLLMAAPIAIGTYMLGYWTASKIISAHRERNRPLMVSTIPLAMVATFGYARQTPTFVTQIETTIVEINAPPEKIWPLLFELPSMPAPKELLFSAGVAHPIAIHSQGQFLGARRDCVLSTGTMPEKISGLEKDKWLRFDVLETPPAMKELNPFGKVESEHLKGYFVVNQGEFKLIPLPGGRTRLVGTSVYSLRMYPAIYWSLWTDTVVEQVHRRVMNEIKTRVESQAQTSR